MPHNDHRQEIFLTNLPSLVLEKILLYLSYDQIAQIRQVSRLFDFTCRSLLNQGFRAAERFHAKCLKEVRIKLPRRESARRSHRLARHCDILTAIETRISLLGITFLKYVDLDLCCFIPGRVIDEIFSVLKCIQEKENPPRGYEILQELRDISSMAMEYFDEKIVPTLNACLPISPLQYGSTGFSLDLQYQPSTSTPTGHQPRCLAALSEPTKSCSRSIVTDEDMKARSAKKLSKKSTAVINCLKKKANAYKGTVAAQNKKIVELDRRIDQQDEVIHHQNTRLAEQEEKLAEMGRSLSVIIGGGGVKRNAEEMKEERNKKGRFESDV
eukprot:GFUD01006045.1.p1 GENE.GFUD01006045.1~~GFUD01006045.1.p1  ORF type:complete len:327 (+),score=92.43 GFUD01006045.1:98-1078(+)